MGHLRLYEPGPGSSSHTYLPGTVGCETTVRLSAENACNTLQGGPSIATFNPIRVWDIDTANISPSATLLCWPDNEVTYLNTTNRNCLTQGNIFQRYESWNFGDYWGAGHDSIIDWTPWPPTFPHTIAYPAIGTYEVMMLDSNYCGIDTAYVTINIVPPPSVTLTANPTPVCAGHPVHFNETTIGGANYFQWDFDDGNGFNWTSAGDQDHTFNTQGTYDVRYAASIQGATAGCADTAMATVTVLPSPTAQFTPTSTPPAPPSLLTRPTPASTRRTTCGTSATAPRIHSQTRPRTRIPRKATMRSPSPPRTIRAATTPRPIPCMSMAYPSRHRCTERL